MRDFFSWLLEPLHRILFGYMVNCGFILLGGKGSQPPPPDYEPMAKASTESAKIAADLGREQLAEGRRQYENTAAVAKPVVDAQLALMQQGIKQGDDYYQYGTSFRNLEQEMKTALSGPALVEREKADQQRVNELTAVSQRNADSLKTAGANTLEIGRKNADELRDLSLSYRTDTTRDTNELRGLSEAYTQAGVADSAKLRNLADAYTKSGESDSAELRGLSAEYTQAGVAGAQRLRDRSNAYEQDVGGDIALFTGADSGIYNKYRDDIENSVGTAIADAREGQSKAYSDAMRQAMRFGIDLPSSAGAVATQGASAIASAANGTRVNSLKNYRGVIGQGVSMKGDVFKNSQSAMIDALSAEQSARSGSFNMRSTAVDAANRARLGGLNIQSTAMDAASRARSGGFNMLSDAVRMDDAGRKTAYGMLTDSMNTADKGRTVGYGMYADGLSKEENSAMTGYNLGTQNRSLNWAKQLDITGMARGMPGASQGAYSTANQSGNSAVANTGAAGNSLMNSMNQGASTIMNGRSLYQQGLGGILNSQSSAYNAGIAKGDGGFMSDLGAIAGAGAKLYAASDRRLKENIVLVGTENGHNLYTFNYITDPSKRFQGVMADEVAAIMPEAVVYDSNGMAAVRYDLIGVTFKEIEHGT